VTAAISLSAVAGAPAHAAPPIAADSAQVTTTLLTLKFPSCEGCEVGVASFVLGSTDDWSAKPKVVKDGIVRFVVPKDRTDGLSITVRAPWEGATGYVTNVALRYKGQDTWDRVDFATARTAKRASACWAGTDQDAATMKVRVRKVQVEGYGGKVAGTIAWAAVTQDWLRPIVASPHGVVGTQDVMPCMES
jgi:hypothetical protein